jgi:hypothetical protein
MPRTAASNPMNRVVVMVGECGQAACGRWPPTPTASTVSRTTPALSSRPTRWRAGRTLADHLDRSDAYGYFDAIGDLLVTGPRIPTSTTSGR